MELVVDFNRLDKAGRVPALIPSALEGELVPGAHVNLVDGEGTYCEGWVDEIGGVTGSVALVILDKRSLRHRRRAPATSRR